MERRGARRQCERRPVHASDSSRPVAAAVDALDAATPGTDPATDTRGLEPRVEVEHHHDACERPSSCQSYTADAAAAALATARSIIIHAVRWRVVESDECARSDLVTAVGDLYSF